jgi:DNA primase
LVYLLNETFDTKFQTHNYEKLYGIFKNLKEKGGTLDLKNLLANFPHESKTELIDLVHQSWEVSPHWTGRHQILIPTEKDELAANSYKASLRFKKRYVEKLMNEASQDIRTAVSNEEDFEKILTLQSVFLELKKVQVLLSKELGIVIG